MSTEPSSVRVIKEFLRSIRTVMEEVYASLGQSLFLMEKAEKLVAHIEKIEARGLSEDETTAEVVAKKDELQRDLRMLAEALRQVVEALSFTAEKL